MKKSKTKYQELLDFDNLCFCYKVIKSKTKHKKKLNSYELFLSSYLINLYNILQNHSYKHKSYNIFLIKDPKYIIIMSERIDDRIVNLLITNKILILTLEPKLIDSNTATRIGKGTSYAFKLCKKYLNELKKIPFYKKGRGLAIGNVSSQILAIFYLNNFDHFIKERLNCKYYLCYMDDGIILNTSKERLFLIRDEIKKELERIGSFIK